MRWFFDLVAGEGILDQFLHLIGHLRKLAGQSRDLLALRNNDVVQIIDRLVGVCQIDFEFIDTGFLVAGHGQVSVFENPVLLTQQMQIGELNVKFLRTDGLDL